MVKEAALDNGFWDLGRFSVEYRKLFGESPSVTLRPHNPTLLETEPRKRTEPPIRLEWAFRPATPAQSENASRLQFA
jgi:AraC-like DNA-binding protein